MTAYASRRSHSRREVPIKPPQTSGASQPFSRQMLSQVLKELEEQGIVNRKVYEVVPPKVEYSLTKEGKKLSPIMKAMNDYGQKFVVE